jgi:hypothetical protein
MELGERISFLTVPRGVDVVSADGKVVGKLEFVLKDESSAIFDGLVVDIRLGPGGRRFVDAPQVDEIRERGIVLTLDAAAVEALPKTARRS